MKTTITIGIIIGTALVLFFETHEEKPKPPPQPAQDAKTTQPGYFSQLRGDDGKPHEY